MPNDNQLPLTVESEHFDIELGKLFLVKSQAKFVDAWDFAGSPQNDVILRLTKEIGSTQVEVTLSLVTEPDLLLHDTTNDRTSRWFKETPDASVLAWLRLLGDEQPFRFEDRQFLFEVREPARLAYTATVDGVEVPGLHIIEPGRPSPEAIHEVWVRLVRGLGLAR